MRILIAAALMLTVAVPGAAQNRNAVPEAKSLGKPVSCIPIRQIRQSLVRNDRVIDFKLAGGKVYRNTLPNACPQLGFERRFSYTTTIAQLCSVDIVTVLLNQGPGLQPGAGCALGEFQPVELADKRR